MRRLAEGLAWARSCYVRWRTRPPVLEPGRAATDLPGANDGGGAQVPAPEGVRFGRRLGTRRLWTRRLGLRLLGVGALAFFLVALWRSSLEAPPPTVLLRDRHQTYLADIAAEPERGYGFWPVVPVTGEEAVERLPARVVAATLAIEDRRFHRHFGVDPLAIGRALWQNLQGGRRVSGASTLAMQVARMQNPGGRGYVRKALEALTATLMTVRHGREAVLAHYLRIVPYGNQIHGIHYAARRYLDKPVADLSWAEVAFLTAIPQSPSRMNPYDPRGRARAVARGRRILETLRERGELSAADFALADAQITRLAIPAKRQRNQLALHLILRLERLLRAGNLPAEWQNRPWVDLPLDLGIQQEMAWILGEEVERWRPRGAGNGALMVVDTQTWEVVAALGSVDFFASQEAGAIDYLATPRSPGSTLKPFVFALGLDQGLYTPATILDDLRRGAGGIANSDAQFLGPMLPRAALANSRNVPAANLLQRVGLYAAWDLMAELGLHRREDFAEQFGLGLVIGSFPVKLEDLVGAYTSLAGEGLRHDLVFYPGQRVAPPRRVLSVESARLISIFLADPSARLPTFPRLGRIEFPFAVAVKTGTSSQYKDALTVAYSSRYLVGAWIGDPGYRSMVGVTGYLAAGGLVQRAMSFLHPDLLDGQQATLFQPPDGYRQVKVCSISGHRATAACDRAELEWLKVSQAETWPDCTVHRLLAVDRRDGLLASHWTPSAQVEVRSFVDLPTRYASYMGERGLLPPPTEKSRLGTGELEPQFAAGPTGGKTATPTSAAGIADGALRITSPAAGQRLLFDPETPVGLATVALTVEVEPPVPTQILWWVDGAPYRLEDFPFNARWALTRGSHRFQAQIPGTDRFSPVVRVIVD